MLSLMSTNNIIIKKCFLAYIYSTVTGAFGVVCKGVLLAASNPPVQVAVKMAKS